MYIFRKESVLELALLSARIFTANPDQPWAEAMIIKGNKILAVGRNDQIKGLCGKDTEIMELPGRLVTPGLVDTHCHFILFGLSLQMVSLSGLTSLEACREKIKLVVASRKPGEWIFGRGWNQYLWKENEQPTRFDLDDITPDNPVMLSRADGHSVWVNSLVISRANIDRHTPDPPRGEIVRDPDSGEPTGIFREAANVLVRQQVPERSLGNWKEGALAAQEDALSCGITGVHSCESLQQWEILKGLEEEGRLKVRVLVLPFYREIDELVSRHIKYGQGSERLWFGQAKLFADGTLGSGTALLHEPYTDDPSQTGIEASPPSVLAEGITQAYRHGWDVAIHAIGDKGITNALEAISAARKVNNIAENNHKKDRLEHVQLIRPEDLNLFHELGVVASVQPVFLPTDWSIAEKKWGHERCRYAYAWKTLLKAGIPLQFGSDAPFDRIKPLNGLQATVTRQDVKGEPAGGWFPEERLNLGESIKGFTIEPARTAGKDDILGSLVPGKLADVTIFEEDLFEIEPKNWPNVEVEMTISDGEIVYQK
jgi:predicted amidohydrolase YtcJ